MKQLSLEQTANLWTKYKAEQKPIRAYARWALLIAGVVVAAFALTPFPPSGDKLITPAASLLVAIFAWLSWEEVLSYTIAYRRTVPNNRELAALAKVYLEWLKDTGGLGLAEPFGQVLAAAARDDKVDTSHAAQLIEHVGRYAAQRLEAEELRSDIERVARA